MIAILSAKKIMLYENKELLEMLGQAVMGSYFIFQGTKNILSPAMVLGRLQTYKFPYPKAILWFGIVMMYSGGALVLFDYYTELGASILFVFTLLATAIFQRWWTVEDPVRRPYNYLMFFYNVFIMGALLLLM